MNLLLLLSALLSALTGMNAGARAVDTTVAVARVIETEVSIKGVKAAPSRPSALSLTPGTADLVLYRPWQIFTSEPLFASRRRE